MHNNFKIQDADPTRKIIEKRRRDNQDVAIQNRNALIGRYERDGQMPEVGDVSISALIDKFQRYESSFNAKNISMARDSQENSKEANLTPSQMSCFHKSKLEKICKSKVFNQQKVKENCSKTFLDLIYEKNEKTAEYELKNKEVEADQVLFFKESEALKERVVRAKEDNLRENETSKKDLIIQERSIIFSEIMKMFENKKF